jgi:two-component system chemotaxis response regulator CheB
MANRDVMAIGTSAGGVEALLFLAKAFRPNFPAAILITIHLSSHYRSSLDKILTGAGPLPARFAQDGEPAKKGHIYLAPPGCHLLFDGDRLVLGTGARENNARPAIDPMLRSAAICCGGRAVGVVLTGTLGDGASGLWALGQCGGITVVQDPHDAAFPEMPMTALNRARPDHVVPLAQMPALLDSLIQQPVGETRPAPERLRFEVEVARNGPSSMSDMDRVGRRSVLSCPDCGGVMWEIDEDDLIRFRCHVGHAYTAELMSLALDDNLRRALASARRAYEERAALLTRMEERAVGNGRDQLAETWRQKAKEYRKEAEVIDGAIQRLERMARQPGKI